MKKKPAIEGGNDDFKRFDDLFRKVISVPKEELKRREEAEKKAKSATRKQRS